MATYSELHNATEELCLEDDLFLDRVKPNSKWRWSPFFLRISMSILFICLMVIGIFSRRFDRISRSGTQYQSGIDADKVCKSPEIRAEWRTLTKSKRKDYISAVRCLATKPSRLNSNDTLYDDFTHVHILLDDSFHINTSFLAWHRYYLHVYEKTLREECGFKWTMPYWDWSLDSEDLTASPVFDSQYGFGGDGNQNARTLGNRGCVTDGPISDMSFRYFNSDVAPHCLFRTFDYSKIRLSGGKYSASAIDKILKKPDISSFLKTLNSAHISVHEGLGGDMEGLSAPNDPIFFLHHGQVDRLWWLWQQSHMQISRTSGFALNTSLAMSGLVKDIELSEVLDTNTQPFCYRY